MPTASEITVNATHPPSQRSGTCRVPWNIGRVTLPTAAINPSTPPSTPTVAWASVIDSSGSGASPRRMATSTAPAIAVTASAITAMAIPERSTCWPPRFSRPGSAAPAKARIGPASSTLATPRPVRCMWIMETANTARPRLNAACSQEAERPSGIGVAAATGRNCSRLPSMALPSTPRVNRCTSTTVCGAQRLASVVSPWASRNTPATMPQTEAVSSQRSGRCGGGALAKSRPLMRRRRSAPRLRAGR